MPYRQRQPDTRELDTRHSPIPHPIPDTRYPTGESHTQAGKTGVVYICSLLAQFAPLGRPSGFRYPVLRCPVSWFSPVQGPENFFNPYNPHYPQRYAANLTWHATLVIDMLSIQPIEAGLSVQEFPSCFAASGKSLSSSSQHPLDAPCCRSSRRSAMS